MEQIQIFRFLTVLKMNIFFSVCLLFSGSFCQQLQFRNAGDFDTTEYYETQLLACLLKGPACYSGQQLGTQSVPGSPDSPNSTPTSNAVAIQALVQFDFTNGSVVNSGSVAITLSSPELSPSTTVGKDGDSNGAYLYTTNNQYFTAVDTGLPMGASPRTMCAWIKPSSLPAGGLHHMVFRYGTISPSQSSVLSLSNSSGAEISFFGNAYDAVTNYTITTNVWSHFCATFNGGTTASLYVNGSLIASPSFLGTGPLNTISGSFAIGTWTGSGGPAFYWRGALDDVRIYNVALSATQISQIHSTGTAYQ
jgi:hypothetical protein